MELFPSYEALISPTDLGSTSSKFSKVKVCNSIPGLSSFSSYNGGIKQLMKGFL